MLRLSRYFVCFLLMFYFSSCDSDEDWLSESASSDPTLRADELEPLEEEHFSDLIRSRLGTADIGSRFRQSCGCRKILARLSSSGQINPPLLTTTGKMYGTLKGNTSYKAYLADLVQISSDFGNDPIYPSASFIGTLTLTNRKGSITFRDIGVFEQIPNGLGTSFARVIEGTDFYRGASGFLFLNLISDDTGLNFEGMVRGEIYCSEHGIKNHNQIQ